MKILIGYVITYWKSPDNPNSSPYNAILKSYIGKEIVQASIKYDDSGAIILEFSDNTALEIFDHSWQCIESRYLTIDDNIQDLVGGKLLSIKVREIKKLDTTDTKNFEPCHEVAFVEIATDKDFVTFCTHVEYDGYYGGFVLSIKEVK